MAPTRLLRGTTLIAAAALMASLTVATVAAPTTAAKPKCDGKVATIVSWKKVIRGTKKADVIVAKGTKNNVIYGKGGRDRICAGKGNDKVYGAGGMDRLFGQAGRDSLFGQAGDDRLDGGPSIDECRQGTGSGKKVRCELPLVPPSADGKFTYAPVGGNEPTRAISFAASTTDPVSGVWTWHNLETGVFRTGPVTCLVVEQDEAFMFGPPRVGGRAAFLWVKDEPAGDSAVLWVQDLPGDPVPPQTLAEMEGWCRTAGATYSHTGLFPLLTGQLTVTEVP